MDFITFARLHGITMDALPPFGRWTRWPTVDHPKSRNGAVKYMGDHAFIQNHATMTEVALWNADKDAKPVDMAALNKLAEAHNRRRTDDQEKARKKAGWILHQCSPMTHEYLARKGFPMEKGNVWNRQADDGTSLKLLCIPMRVCGEMVGVQLIGPSGEKKFLMGQRTSDAVFTIDNKGPTYLCEGYATALSLRKTLATLRMRYRIEVCFSAGNMARRAKAHPDAFLIADNDRPSQLAPDPGGMGLKVAKESGLRYWISDREAEDFNDFAVRLGEYRASQSLKKALGTP